MKKLLQSITGVAVLAGAGLFGQDVILKITGGDNKPKLAVPEFKGAGGTGPLMTTFNSTLFSDLQESGLVDMVAKSMYPIVTPQRPEDFRPAPSPDRRTPTERGGVLSDWSAPPPSATHLVFGYAAEQNGQFTLLGWLYDASQPLAQAQLLTKRYFTALDADGARLAAHQFAADILAQFGGKSLAGTKVFFVSDRTGSKELWSMDPDGSNQKPFTNYKSISITPGVSADGSKIAFTTYARGNPEIFVHSTETGRKLPFFNQRAPMNATPGFAPDGRILYSSSVSKDPQIYVASPEGGNPQRLTVSRSIEMEPKVSPTGNEVVFISGRGGFPQVYKMTIDGSSPERLTTGEGEAGNPSWHPNGQVIAFKWTRGFEIGNFNIFIMDVASRRFDQLTHGAGRNENPDWAPDGRHIVFASTRRGKYQIFTMLADGTQVKQLTTQGSNTMPVWAPAPGSKPAGAAAR